MSKKTLNVEGITNELEGASLYFTKQPTPLPSKIEPEKSLNPGDRTIADSELESPKDNENNKKEEVLFGDKNVVPVMSQTKSPITKRERTTGRTVVRTDERTDVRSNNQTTSSTLSRIKIRNSFDIFSDQLMSLREIAIDEEKIFGERVLLGDLVQQALDMFIAKKKNAK